jgi:ribose 1,5-bisphosphokinase PhnN
VEALAARAGADLGRASELLERALAGFIALDASWEAARTSLTLAEVLADGEKLDDDARQLLAKARTVFERLQAVRELARADELAQRLG